MKNFKRVVSFVMAMVIFASFFCYNVGAVTYPNYAFYLYSGNFVQPYFSDTNAYAWVGIRNWAEETNTTDLRASTYAHVDDYVDIPCFFDATTYVQLIVLLEDGTQRIVFDNGNIDPDGGTIDALVRGRDCLNQDNHSSIVAFETWHEVEIFFRIPDAQNDYGYYSEYDGYPILISTGY